MCPNCFGQWTAAGFVASSWFAPRATRAVATVFATYAVADVAQLGYAKLVHQ